MVLERLTYVRFSAAARRAVALLAVYLLQCACLHHASGRKVDVGGYRLRIHCSGSGSPTIVMDSGLGDTLESWSEVYPGVQRFTRVCAYDRAGLGASDRGPMPRTSQRIADELHALLENAKVKGPYVLVGHSFGGLNVRLYAIEHPRDVLGLILIDATHEDYPSREQTLKSPAERRKMENVFGLASPAARSEYESMSESVKQVRDAGSLPDIPLIVITAGRRDDNERLKKAWMELQKDLVKRAPRGRQIIAEKSGHYVQFDEPALVVESIREMVEQVRSRQ